MLSLYGMSNIVGPVIGPMFGGYIGEALGWQWGFYMVLPVSVLAYLLFRFFLPPDGDRRARERRSTGSASCRCRPPSPACSWCSRAASGSTGTSRARSGSRRWSPCIAFYVFLTHSLTAPAPFLNLGLFRDRNYAIGCVIVTLYGMLNFAPVVLLPPLLQQHAGFPD